MAQFGLDEKELKKRITVIFDEHHFNFKEDSYVWSQKRDLIHKTAEIYFDDQWICDFHTSDTPTQLTLKYFKGFLKAYEEKKIRLNLEVKKLEDELFDKAIKDRKKEALDKVKQLPDSTVEQRISKEVVKELVQEKL